MNSFLRLLGAALFSFPSLAIAADRPNIVFIFADDLGWSDVGWQGTDFYETPHLDALAKQGMVFTSASAAAATAATGKKGGRKNRQQQ